MRAASGTPSRNRTNGSATPRRARPHWPVSVAAPRPPRARAAAAAPLVAVSAAARALDAPESSSSGSESRSRVRIRLAAPEDYWEASDLHCACFFETENTAQRQRRGNLGGPPPGPPASPLGRRAAYDGRWMPTALRVDRCVALQINDDLEKRGVGRTALLLAEEEEEEEDGEEDGDDDDDGETASGTSARAAGAAAAAAEAGRDPLAFPRPLFFLARLLQPPVRAGLDAAIASRRPRRRRILCGAATVDSFGDLVPPRALDASRDGAVGWVRREGYAYMSNVAVAPGARRRGVARLLVRAAERLAAGKGLEEEEETGRDGDEGSATAAAPWSCRTAALHCSPSNEAALRLYGSLGYRRVALEPAWAPYLSGRGAGGRCYLMVRRLH